MKNYYIFLRMLMCFLATACHANTEKQDNSHQNNNRSSIYFQEKNKEVKPGAAVSLASDDIIYVGAGKSKKINILLEAHLGEGAMHVEVTPSKGLQLLSHSRSLTYEFDASASAQYPLAIDVLAEKEGRYYLNLNVIITDGENSLSRVLAIIIQTQSLTSNTIKIVKPVINERVISLPAQETISNH